MMMTTCKSFGRFPQPEEGCSRFGIAGNSVDPAKAFRVCLALDYDIGRLLPGQGRIHSFEKQLNALISAGVAEKVMEECVWISHKTY